MRLSCAKLGLLPFDISCIADSACQKSLFSMCALYMYFIAFCSLLIALNERRHSTGDDLSVAFSVQSRILRVTL